MLPQDKDIPIAQFGTSNIATAKTVYRRGLAVRYGAKMQTISGIHYNFSIANETWSRVYGASHDRNELITINLGFNLNELIYYGDFPIFSDKLLKDKIKIKIENNTQCIISSIN